MTTYKQGDIVLVPVPFTDQTTSKRRPAIVVSANWYNKTRADTVLVPITSTVHKSLQREEFLIRGSEVQRAGLYKESVAKCGAIFTVRQKLILKRIGTMSSGTLRQIHTIVADILSGKTQSQKQKTHP